MVRHGRRGWAKCTYLYKKNCSYTRPITIATRTRKQTPAVLTASRICTRDKSDARKEQSGFGFQGETRPKCAAHTPRGQRQARNANPNIALPVRPGVTISFYPTRLHESPQRGGNQHTQPGEEQQDLARWTSCLPAGLLLEADHYLRRPIGSTSYLLRAFFR